MIKNKLIAAAVAAGAAGTVGAGIALAAPASAAPNCDVVVDSINNVEDFTPTSTEKWTCAAAIQANKWATFPGDLAGKWTGFPGDLAGRWTSYPGDLAGRWTSYPGDLAGRWTQLPRRPRRQVGPQPRGVNPKALSASVVIRARRITTDAF